MNIHNPLLQNFDSAPFLQVKTEHFKPAIIEAIQIAKKEIEEIQTRQQDPTFENTIEPLDYAGKKLDRITSIFFNLNSAETNEEIQKIAQEVSPLLSEFKNDLLLNKELFQRIQTIWNSGKSLVLNAEQKTLLENKYKAFTRNGANLSEEDKLKLREIDKELSSLSLQFGEHILSETNKYELFVEDEEKLKGLPEEVKEEAEELAREKGKKGWIFTLDYPVFIPFMKYAHNRELRKELAIAFGAKGFHNDELDNQEIVLKIANLRFDRAQLLGYKSHAHFVLEERMAETPEKVHSFLEDLLLKAKPAAEREFKQLEDFAKNMDNIDQLEKWDSAYYSEKLKKQLFELDEDELKPYFPLQNVIEGVFTVAEKLYDLKFEEINNVDKYHTDVRTYNVTDEDGKEVALFYADFHPRAGKRDGAWMTVYKNQERFEDKDDRPHISIVCNFTKPGKNSPSLLTFNEVTTLFHEFGHALHGMLANTTYPSLSGTSVYWDFVELPSQIFENWCYEREALELFAKHYKTGGVIPQQLINKIKKSANFQEGMATLRQISFGLLDLSWHGIDPSEIKNVKEHELKAFSHTQLFPDVVNNCMSTSFSHIFQGGYSAGYYSYKWAEVLDADAFEYFQETGIFNKETAGKFKDHVLSRGGTEHPMELYKRFRGKEPRPDALLKRAGLIEK